MINKLFFPIILIILNLYLIWFAHSIESGFLVYLGIVNLIYPIENICKYRNQK
jgi:hypothetical protein